MEKGHTMPKIASAGFPVIRIIALTAAVLTAAALFSPGAPRVALGAFAFLGWFFFFFSLYFFRDPERAIPAEPDVLLSPADGTIIDIREMDEPVYLNARARRVSVFMSVFNVHVNRAPVSGTVEFLRYNPGKFISAFKDKASEDNESIFAGIRSECGNIRISVKFIAGLIARRIVFYRQVNDRVAQGERINMIRFGSRVDIFFPLDASVAVKNGDAVTAGVTVLARLR